MILWLFVLDDQRFDSRDEIARSISRNQEPIICIFKNPSATLFVQFQNLCSSRTVPHQRQHPALLACRNPLPDNDYIKMMLGTDVFQFTFICSGKGGVTCSLKNHLARCDEIGRASCRERV